MAVETSKMVYDESVRALNQQAGVLDGLRARAGTLVAAASLVTGFLGGQALAKPSIGKASAVSYPPLNIWAWGAIGAFVIVMASAMWVLWPRGKWVFVMSAAGLLRNVGEPGMDIERMYRETARYMEDYFDENAKKLKWLWISFEIGSFALAVEAGLWLVYLRGGP